MEDDVSLAQLTPTPRSWLIGLLNGNDQQRREAVTFIVQRYRNGLARAYQTTSWFKANARNADWQPKSVVDDFLSDRLLHPRYLNNWAQKSTPLRWWLSRNLTEFYCRERHRSLSGPQRRLTIEPAELPNRESVHRAFEIGWVRTAFWVTLQRLRQDPNQPLSREAATTLRLHVYRGWTRSEVAQRLGLTPGAVAHRGRVALLQLRDVFEEFQELDSIQAPTGTDDALGDRFREEIEGLIRRLLQEDDGPPDDEDDPTAPDNDADLR